MPWTNYHSHTHFCDGTNPPEDYLQAAREQGLAAYGFSSHAPLPWESCQWAIAHDRYADYLSQVRALQDQDDIQIYLGMEIDWVPGHVGPSSDWIREAQLDYTLASVHFVGFYEDGTPWEMDGPNTFFEKGLQEIWKGDMRAVIEAYYDSTRQMVREDCPQVIGHLDKIKMQNHYRPYFDEAAEWYRKEVRHTLEEIAATDAIVEVNTRGMYKGRTLEPYPSAWILREILEQGIPIMLNSDGHHPSEITKNFSETAELLLSLGFTELMALYDREWQPFAFDIDGLHIQ